MADVGGVGVTDYVPTTLSSVQRVSARVAQYQSGSGVVAGIWTPTSPFNAPYPGAGGFSGDPRVLQNYNSIWDGSGSVPTAPGDMLGLWTRQAGDSNWIQDVSGNRMEMAVSPLCGIRNLIPNMMVGGVAGVIGSGGSLPTGCTRSTSGSGMTWDVQYESGTDAGYGAYVDMILRWYGTPAGSNNQQNLIFSNSGPYPVGTTFTQSALIKLESGSMTNVSVFTIRTSSETGTTFTPTSTLTEYSNTRTITGTSGSWVLRWNASSLGVATDITLRIRLPQTEIGSTVTARQQVYAMNNVTQLGQPSIYMPRSGGSGFFKFPAVGFGTATQGCFADTGQSWHIFALARMTATGVAATIVAQCGTTAANQMLRCYVAADNTLRVVVRGTETNTAVVVTNTSLFYPIHIDCSNGAVTVRVASAARVSCTVGSAAAETQVLTVCAHNAAAPASIFTGRAFSWVEDRSWTASEELNANAWCRANIATDIP